MAPSSALRAVALVAVVVAFAAAAPARAQQYRIDEPVRAGALTLFPDMDDASVFYYVPDKARLATDAHGRPQFSFLRYVHNVRSGAAEEELREGEGGGIVHALVELGVTDEQLREAQRELRRVAPGGTIRGPVLFESGRFGLVSSFTDTDGELSEQVVGLGNAPLLDGEKAAVSMQLTKLGAKILWESFQTPTPDVSFTFEMEIEGYRSPHRAVIEADFDQVYEHKAFGAGVASTYLAAEIRGAFDDLRREGAIRLTQVGDDEDLDKLITVAYNKIAEIMFQPFNGSGTPDLASLAGGGRGQPSLLDRATKMLSDARRDSRTSTTPAPRTPRAPRTTRPATTTPSRRGTTPSAAQTARTTPATTTGPHISPTARAQGARPPERTSHDQVGRLSHEQASAREAGRDERREPPLAVVAVFEMKRIRQRGHFTIDLNKYTTDSMTLRFDENIGDLRRLFEDETHFYQVNLDDPLYRQREVVAFVDGVNAADFGEMVNFVSVHVRKRHQSGAETHDEVRIDRDNFNAEGNRFKLLYGWKGDDDRRRWMEYDYRAVWSFFGGLTIEEPWQTTTAGAINLAPPCQRRRVDLEADPDLIADAGVRAITVKLFYAMGEGEGVQQVTLNPSRGELSRTVEFMLPRDRFDYDYEITWRLRGNRTVSSGRQSASESILFVDELPVG